MSDKAKETKEIKETKTTKETKEAKEVKKENKENKNTAKGKEDENSKPKSRFAHLNNISKVVSKNRNTSIVGAMVAIAVIVLIVVFMFSGKHHLIPQTQNQEVTNHDLILKRNAERLAKERGQHPMAVKVAYGLSNSTVQKNSAESKEMIARRNAPTLMFSASPASISSGLVGEARTNKTLVGSGHFAQFANSQSSTISTVTGKRIAHPRYTIAEGEFIQATLETAINSDLPGMVRAVITRPVYAYVGERPIIPAGSRLIGQYTSAMSNGSASARVFVIWNRVITPTGISIMINSPGNDMLGRAGMGADDIDSHFIRIFGTATLLSVLGAVVANSGVGSFDQPNSADMYRQSIASAFQQSSQGILSKNLNIKPTIHVYQGDAINVFVAHDLDLYSVLGENS